MTQEIDPRWLGPCMLALTPRRQRFVLAMASDPLGTHADWARAAGYSENGAKANAHHAYHDPKVQAAVVEVARATLTAQGPLLAVHALMEAARDPRRKDHAKALEMILNRTGLSEKQQIEVVHRDLTGDALMERIRMLAAKHGVDVRKLLEKGEDGRVIEGTVVKEEVADDGHGLADGSAAQQQDR